VEKSDRNGYAKIEGKKEDRSLTSPRFKILGTLVAFHFLAQTFFRQRYRPYRDNVTTMLQQGRYLSA